MFHLVMDKNKEAVIYLDTGIDESWPKWDVSK